MPTRAASRRLRERATENDINANNRSNAPKPLPISPADDEITIAASEPSASLTTSTSFAPVNSTDETKTGQSTGLADNDDIAQPATSKTEPQKRLKTRAGITRKTLAEREELQKAEDARRKQRLANQPAANETPTSGQARETKRGGKGPQRTRNQQAVGPLGADSSEPQKGRGRRLANATETELIQTPQDSSPLAPELEDRISEAKGVTSEPKIKAKGTAKGKGKSRGRERADPGIREEETSYVSSGDEIEGRKRRDIEDIERIDLSSEEDDDLSRPMNRRGGASRPLKKPGLGLRPVRAHKEEHIARPVGIAADSRRYRDDVKQVKIETDEDEVIIEAPVTGEDPVQAIDRGKSVAIEDEVHADEHVVPEPVQINQDERSKGRKPRKSSFRNLRLAAETIDERLERERLETDLVTMRELWHRQPPTEIPQSSHDVSQDSSTDSTFTSRDGQVFLMQFPPLTPMLVDPTREAERDLSSRRTDNVASEAQVEVKRESKQVNPVAGSPSDTRMLTAASGQLPPGLAGKLKVHRSGKVTIDWGGTDMVVGLGTQVNFLQDLLLTGSGGGNVSLEAFALAQVREKLVVTPDWQKMYD